MKLNRKWLLVIALVLSMTMAISGTLAYLTDRDSAVNTFTVGDVSIKLNEKFTQGAQLVPGVRVEKAATITNTGKNDAWVWMTVAVPAVLDDEDTELGKANVLHWNMPGCFWNGYHNQDKYIQSGITDGYLPAGSTGVAAEDSWINNNVAVKQTIDGIEYNVYTFKYVGAITSGETTNIGLSKVFLDENLDIDTDGQWYIVKNGNVTKVDWNSNTNGSPKVYVSAYAMQKDGFNSVEEAYQAYNTQWGDNGTEWGGTAEVVSTDAELTAALAAGNDVIMTEDIVAEAAITAPYGNNVAFIQNGGVLDGGGNTLTVECSGDDYGIMTSGGTIKNLTIDSGCRAIMIMSPTGDVVVDKVNIGGDGVLYAINTGEKGASGVKLIVTNSTLAGWTSYGPTVESASFTNVKFEQGEYKDYASIYGRVLKPYVNTTLTDCSFIEHMNLDLSSLTEGHKVAFTNCTVNGQVVTADVFTAYSGDNSVYDTALFSVDLPSWANSIDDCIAFN